MTEDFRTALEKCPEVVMTETNPLKFFRCEQGNSWAAALRLVQNWTLRRHVFGEEYWLKPTRLKGGALRPKDISLLRKGAFLMLTPPDPQKRQVFIADFGRLQGREEGNARQRLMMYVMINCLNAYTRTHGVDCIVLINGKGMPVKPDNGTMVQATHTKTAFFVNRVILVRDPTDTHTTLKHLFEKFVLALVQRFWGNKFITVAEDSPSSTRLALEHLGIHPSTIPEQLGGDWSYNQVDAWVLDRLKTEQESDSGTFKNAAHPQWSNSDTATTESTDNPTETHTKEECIVHPSRNRGFNSPRCDGDQLLREAREKSAYYSRRSYYRKKEEREQLTRNYNRLRAENDRLRIEEARLESLLINAQAVVENFQSLQSFF